jgi:hypothetical protein
VHGIFPNEILGALAANLKQPTVLRLRPAYPAAARRMDSPSSL